MRVGRAAIVTLPLPAAIVTGKAGAALTVDEVVVGGAGLDEPQPASSARAATARMVVLFMRSPPVDRGVVLDDRWPAGRPLRSSRARSLPTGQATWLVLRGGTTVAGQRRT